MEFETGIVAVAMRTSCTKKSSNLPDIGHPRRRDMIEFRKKSENEVRSAEIEASLKKLDAEMASPNIKEVKHEELSKLRDQLTIEQAAIREPAKRV
jgi:hypothetical protein